MSITPGKVSAVVVTRGDVDLRPIIASLPYDEVIIYDNSREEKDYKVYGRYEAAKRAKHDVIYFQDDDIIFTEHEKLMQEYEPGVNVCNMPVAWSEDCGYEDLALGGLGSLCDKGLWEDAHRRYLDKHPFDDLFLNECDFIFGVLGPYRKVDLGAEILPVASADNRLWTQDWQMDWKWTAIKRARALKTVCLALIVKNEIDHLPRALESAKGLYDKVCIIDTGSTDGTLEYLQGLARNGVQGAIAQHPWADFGTNRNALLKLAAKQDCDYILMMDADETFEGWTERPELVQDLHYLHYTGEFDTGQPRYLKVGKPWVFRDRVHAWLDCEDPDISIGHLYSPLVHHHGVLRHYEDKLRSDVVLLREQLDKDPTDARSVFNLAKALEGLDHLDQAMELYELRLTMQGCDEEKWYSRYKLGCLTGVQKSFAEASRILLEAWEERPHRIEPLRALAIYCNDIADQAPYPVGDILFIQRGQYKGSPTTPEGG